MAQGVPHNHVLRRLFRAALEKAFTEFRSRSLERLCCFLLKLLIGLRI